MKIYTGRGMKTMPTWNDQQLKAIQTKERNILVSASAGSGKTTVLIARLMDLVMKDRVSIDQILAMTFTEAAANEMKKRLASELQQALVDADEEETLYITRQLTSIQTAHISTIHSFCLSIIQDYYYIIGLHPERVSNIMDNASMALFQKQALEATFQEQYQRQDPTFTTLCQMFSSRSENDEALSAMIRNLATLASSKSNSDAWLDDICEMYHNIKTFQDIPEDIRTNFFEYLLVETTRYEEAIIKIAELYQYRYEDAVKKAAIVKQKLDAFPPLKEALQQVDYEAYRMALFAITHAIIPPCPDKEDKMYARLRKMQQDVEDHLLAITFSQDQLIKDMNQLYPYVVKLVDMCRTYRKTYAQLKEEQLVIDFDDMEHFALAILQANDGQVAQAYRNMFVEIMVDEFQDSNDVQNELVMLICKENNVFRVGDIKQSIYGFRHAKPQLMRGLIDERGDHDEVIYLSNNYRSKKKIVDFNNELFKVLMNIPGFSCSYAKEDDVETGVPEQLVQSVPTIFHVIYHDTIKENEGIILSKNELKASYIASQIVEIKEKEERKWKDFVVLVRSNARKESMKAVFDEWNIPYFIDVKSGFYQSSAVQIMISALTCLSNPDDNIAFTALMLSPLFQCSIDDMAQAKRTKERDQSFYRYFIQHPFQGFERFLNLRDLLYQLSLSDMLNQLYACNQYYERYTTIQEKTNLDLLFDKALQFEQQYATGIHAFLQQISQIKDEQTAEAIPIGSEANVVRVMSIHQSKGLQFPVVFLWSTDKMMPVEFKDFCISDGDMGIAMKCMDLPKRFVRTTMPRIAMEHKKDKEELEEEMRILYVATTRAQQQMHIVDCVKSLHPYQTPLTMAGVYDRGGYTSWILQTFLHIENELFNVKEVESHWETIVQTSVEEKPAYTITKYVQPTKTVEFITASTNKQSESEFDLQDTRKAVSYGTQMHKMIEHLHNGEWSTERIKEVALSLAFDLFPRDIKTLQTLYHDEIFQEVLKQQCYYELPFIAHDDQTVLHGLMDVVAIQDDHITIIDFKTDSVETPDQLIERYTQQLALYRKAMMILYPNATIQTYVYSLHLHQMINVLA